MNIACSISIGNDYLTLELNEVGKDETDRVYASYLISEFYKNALRIGKPHRGNRRQAGRIRTKEAKTGTHKTYYSARRS